MYINPGFKKVQKRIYICTPKNITRGVGYCFINNFEQILLMAQKKTSSKNLLVFSLNITIIAMHINLNQKEICYI